MMAFSLVGLSMLLTMFVGIVIVAGIGISKFSNRPSLDREVSDRLAEIEARLYELAEDTHARLAEVEERTDITERVLADVRARKEIPPGV
jgi:hypothetical protein